MKQRLRLGIVVVIGLLAPVAVRGDGNPPAAGGGEAIPTDWMTPKEKEAFDLLQKEKPVSARRIADVLIKDDPDSIVANYVLGRILHETEGSLGRAIYHLGHARELYEDRFSTSDPSSAPWKFHRDLLLSVISLAGEMEEYDYQLSMLEYHDQLYRPSRVGEQAWPLMKLGRLDDAREAARKAIEMKDPGQRSLGLNVLCAIERSTNDREAARKACTAAFDHAQGIDRQIPDEDNTHSSSLAVHAYNAALAARADFAADEAERIALAGTKRLAFTPANPWRFLVELYVDEGRGSEAANALREMHRWRTRQPPQLRDQDRAETDVVIATVLMLAGRTEAAHRLVDRAIEFPDRRGLESTSAWQAHAAHVLLRDAIRRADDQVIAEADAIADAGGRGLVGGASERMSRWADDETLTGLLQDDDRLIDTFRLFGERGVTPVPVWLLGDLIHVVGPGVMAVVLRMVREREPVPKLEPYWLSFDAEVHLERGRDADARATADRALATLPETEALLRARTAAVAAEAAGNSGDGSAELNYLVRAYQLDPSVIRRRGLSLPARFTGGGAGADKAIALLQSSPRFRSSSGGFIVDVQASPDLIRICLRSPDGGELRCVPEDTNPPPPPPPGPDGKVKPPEPVTPERAVEEFHKYAFAMTLGLTGADMSSLDGSTTVAEQAVREQMDKVFEEVTKP